MYILTKQKLRRMIHVVVRERRDREVAVVVPFLVADQERLVVAGFFGRGGEVLREELALLVEVVGCALWEGGLVMARDLWVGGLGV